MPGIVVLDANGALRKYNGMPRAQALAEALGPAFVGQASDTRREAGRFLRTPASRAHRLAPPVPRANDPSLNKERGRPEVLASRLSRATRRQVPSIKADHAASNLPYGKLESTRLFEYVLSAVQARKITSINC